MPAADQVLAFLGTLPIVSGLRAGETMELLAFQEQFVRGVYAETAGEWLVRLAALSVARGNGKSALLAGLSLAHLLGPMREPYGECYAAALDREQAGVLFRMVRAYIEATPWMAAAVNVRDWHKSIEVEADRSTWTALTSDARKAHGLAPSFWIADEVAQWRSPRAVGQPQDRYGEAGALAGRDDQHAGRRRYAFLVRDAGTRSRCRAPTSSCTPHRPTAPWTIAPRGRRPTRRWARSST